MASTIAGSERNALLASRPRAGRPRSEAVHRAILEAARDLLADCTLASFSLERVAGRARVGKTTIYRRWPSKEALILDLLLEMADQMFPVAETGNTRDELVAMVRSTIAMFNTNMGRVMQSILSELARRPELTVPFRATVVRARRDEVERVITRGVQRGDIRAEVDHELLPELLIGPVYYRLLFGGELDEAFAERIVDAVLGGCATESGTD